MTPATRAAAALRRTRRQLARARAEGFAPGEDPAYTPAAPDHIGGLAVVTCHYNFAGYDAPVRNLLRFCREMDSAGVPVYGIEITAGQASPTMTGARRWITRRVDPVSGLIWQKEAALNALVATLPAAVTAVALVDADVRFEDPRWLAASLDALATSPALQPYTEAVWTDASGIVELRRLCSAVHGLDASWRTHPGFAWVIRRDFWTCGPGLWPWCCTGAGDGVLASGLLGHAPTPFVLRTAGPLNIDALLDWIAAVDTWRAGRPLAAVPGRIWHEWHGSRADRAYVDRHDLNAPVAIGRHLQLDRHGLLQWTPAAPKKMRSAVARYFHRRREDG